MRLPDDRWTLNKWLVKDSGVNRNELSRKRAVRRATGSRRNAGIHLHWKGLNYKLGGNVWGDASAALGIIHRCGLGRTRHIDTCVLWVQQVAAERRLACAKALGRDNPAELFTQHLDVKTSHMQVGTFNCKYIGGRSAVMLELHGPSVSWHEYLQPRGMRGKLANSQECIGKCHGWTQSRKTARPAIDKKLHARISARLYWSAKGDAGSNANIQ